MEINAKLIREHRVRNNWTQQHLADACGLSIRTIQRVERYGNASHDTVSALAAVFSITSSDIVLPEIEVQTQEGVTMPPWVERIVLMVTSSIIGYMVAIFTK